MPAQTTTPPRAVAARRRRHQRADRRKDQRGVERRRSLLVASARPVNAKAPRKRLRRVVARPREGKYLSPLGQRDLRDQVRRRPEAVDAQTARVAGERIRPVADQPGAQERRRVQIVVAFRQRQHIRGVDDSVFGVAAVLLIAGEAGIGAEILAPAAAVIAVPAGVREPGDTDARAECRGLDLRAARDHRSHDLVAGYDRNLRVGQVTVDEMEVRAADPAGMNPDQHLGRARLGTRQRAQDQRTAGTLAHHRLHRRCRHRERRSAHSGSPS